MNCEGYRDKLVDVLAGGEGALGGELAAHLRACADCKEFYEAQVHLFGAIDSGVRAMVNETVPASLLPGVRVLVAEAGMPPRHWGFSWAFAAAVTVAAVLAVSVGFMRWNPENTSKLLGRTPVIAQRERNATGVLPIQPRAVAADPARRSRGTKTATAPRETVKTPEVMVLAEERAAFVRFVTDLPEEREVAVAFTRPATDANDEAVDIALLQIDELEVKPLESSNQ